MQCESLPEVIKDFLPAVPTIINLFHSYLAIDSPSSRKIVINTSPSIQYPYILPEEKKTDDCISVEEFIELIIRRWEKELVYEEEIKKIKDAVYEEFGKFCLNCTDEGFICRVQSYQSKVIDKLFDLTEIESKRRAGEFCCGLMNGFDNELPMIIDDIAFYILHYIFLTKCPTNFLDYLKTTLKDSKDVDQAVENMLMYLDNFFQVFELNFDKRSYIKDFNKILQNYSEENKHCTVKFGVHLNNYDFMETLKLYTSFCVCAIEIVSTAQFFSTHAKNFFFQSLQLSGIKNENIKKIAQFISKSLQKCTFEGQVLQSGMIELSNIFVKTKHITHLHLDFSGCNYPSSIRDLGMQSLCAAAEKFNLKKLVFNFSGGNNGITDFGIEILANILKKMTQIEYLHLYFSNDLQSCHLITDVGMFFLSSALQNISSIKHLALHFGGKKNKISDVGFDAISNSLKKMNLLDFDCDFHDDENSISDFGITSVSLSIKNMTNCIFLSLNFNDQKNKLTDVGIEALSMTIKLLINLKKLSLNFQSTSHTIIKQKYKFRSHLITAKGLEALLEGCTNLLLLKELFLNLRYEMIEQAKKIDENWKYYDEACNEFIKQQKKFNNFALEFFVISIRSNYLSIQRSDNSMINDIGIEYLSTLLINLKQLESLEIMLIGNQGSLNGIHALACAIKNLYCLSNIYLDMKSKSSKVRKQDMITLHQALADKFINKIKINPQFYLISPLFVFFFFQLNTALQKVNFYFLFRTEFECNESIFQAFSYTLHLDINQYLLLQLNSELKQILPHQA